MSSWESSESREEEELAGGPPNQSAPGEDIPEPRAPGSGQAGGDDEAPNESAPGPQAPSSTRDSG